jgi:hypothetical protein
MHSLAEVSVRCIGKKVGPLQLDIEKYTYMSFSIWHGLTIGDT